MVRSASRRLLVSPGIEEAPASPKKAVSVGDGPVLLLQFFPFAQLVSTAPLHDTAATTGRMGASARRAANANASQWLRFIYILRYTYGHSLDRPLFHRTGRQPPKTHAK